MAGAIDSRGIYKYAETDIGSPFSDVLNLGMDSVSNKVATLTSTINSNKTATDAAIAAQGAWQSYAATSPNATAAAVVGWYTLIGETVHFYAEATLGTGGAMTGSVNLTTPTNIFAFSTNAIINGTAECWDSSPSTRFYWNVRRIAANVVQVISPAGVAGGPSQPFTWAAGDVLRVTGTYRKG